jgi:hypothetical protein
VRPGAEPADQQLAAAIPARHTHRERFAEAPPAQTLTAMAAACQSLGVALSVVTGEADRDAVARLVAAGDREQFANPSWRRELAAWMHPRRRGDGLAVPPVAGAVTRFVVSHVDVGARTAGQDETLTREAPTVAVLTTDGDDPRDWLLAGQALQRALLVAAAAGIQAGWSNQPCQVPSLRPRLRETLRIPGQPQVVLRLGRPPSPPRPAPRRPLDDVLEGT